MKTFITLLAFGILITSCKKDSTNTTPAPIYPIQGLWIGTYQTDQVTHQPLFYSLINYPDGTVLTRSKGGDGKYYYSTGTWALSSNNIFSATITTFVTPNAGQPTTQSITATYSNTGTLTSGTWNDTINPNGAALSGKFSTMQRVN